MYATAQAAPEMAEATQPTLRIEGQDAWIAAQGTIEEGINAANAVFASHNVAPLDCDKANKKLISGRELLTKEEAMLSLIWEEADYAAFHVITVGWLSRDIDIQISIR